MASTSSLKIALISSTNHKKMTSFPKVFGRTLSAGFFIEATTKVV